jgi:hypothetical protein
MGEVFVVKFFRWNEGKLNQDVSNDGQGDAPGISLDQ